MVCLPRENISVVKYWRKFCNAEDQFVVCASRGNLESRPECVEKRIETCLPLEFVVSMHWLDGQEFHDYTSWASVGSANVS